MRLQISGVKSVNLRSVRLRLSREWCEFSGIQNWFAFVAIISTFRPMFHHTKQLLAALGIMAAFAISCDAQNLTVTKTNLNVSIPDDSYNGTLASMATVSMPVFDPRLVQNLRVRVGISHTWLGDLVIKLKSPDGTVVTLMSRPGFAETTDNGSSGVGDSSDLSSSFPVTFDMAATVPAETMGNALASSGVVSRDDGISSYIPNRGAAAAGTLNTFLGKTLNGAWELYVGDSEFGDTGTIDSVTLIFDVPTLASLSMTRPNSSNVTLSWPGDNPGFKLESATSLLSPSWQSVTNVPIPNGTGSYMVTLPATNTQRYFRLHNL
jgi:subtilisin-like proprotein convertase family protein